MLRLALVALLGLTSAIKLTHKPAAPTKILKFSQIKTKQDGPPSAEEIMALFDHNGDQEISRDEFHVTMEAIAAEHEYELTEDDMAAGDAMFDEADTNGSDSVDIEELRAVLG